MRVRGGGLPLQCAHVLFQTHSLVLCRSSPNSQRRLSDLIAGVDVGEMGLGLEGHLDDMIAPEFEDIEGMVQREDALDRRLEAAGDSSFVPDHGCK